MAYNQKDYYFHKAKTEKYAARSVFKLQEIDERFKIFKTGYKVLDLGAAPGSWSQYASQKVGPQGRILGVDLQPVKLTLPNAVFITADFRDLNFEEVMKAHGIVPPFDMVLSDMAPKTTGIRITDQTRSLELCQMALAVCDKFLRPRGSFVCKMFHGEEFESFRDDLRARFGRVEVLRPKSTRKESKEIFFIALQFNPR
ncbi:MAG TPA: RlmE family RNA methyltransferase [Bdellovibrionota bacterium]|nr:RlmE family RNA methyltransferase [Bdellovibrionota bacterium]